MVNTRRLDYQYVTATDSELDALLRGESVEGMIVSDFLRATPLHVGKTGVLVAVERNSGAPLRPLVLVAHDEDVRRLCGRYAQLRTELSPLTAWCHLLTPNIYQSLGGIVHEPNLRGTEAAWSGLIVAEAKLLTRRPLAKIRISACLASATYAIGRTKALWKGLSRETVIDRFDLANNLCREKNTSHENQARTSQVRSSFVPIWACLSALADDSPEFCREDLRSLVVALAALREARSNGDPSEAGLLVRPLLQAVPEVRSFERLTEMTPEARLRLFDELVGKFKGTDAGNFLRRNALALSTGYLATVAAGGAASLALVESDADRWPELTGWAYLIGGIGEKITWTSGFDGLGRLVARELERRLRLDEPPTCDFALDEALVVSDTELEEPLVHLRIKQARVLSVALFPGVNTAIPIDDTMVQEGTKLMGARRTDLLEMFATELWPLLQPLVREVIAQDSTSESRGRKGFQQRSRGKKKEGASSRSLWNSKK